MEQFENNLPKTPEEKQKEIDEKAKKIQEWCDKHKMLLGSSVLGFLALFVIGCIVASFMPEKPFDREAYIRTRVQQQREKDREDQAKAIDDAEIYIRTHPDETYSDPSE